MKSLITLLLAFCFLALTVPKTNAMSLDVNKIESVDFDQSNYSMDVFEKKQIVLHHTASGKSPKGDIAHWSKPGRIACPVIVGHDGTVYRLFSSKYWAHHLGIKQSIFNKNNVKDTTNLALNRHSIGLEIDSWGPLKLKDGKFVAWPNDFGSNGPAVIVDESEVQEYTGGFMGYEYYQKYTDAQLESTAMLLEYWSDFYDIPLDYNSDMWNLSKNALKGKPGVWTHVSFRGKEKSDCHPQRELIEMLNSLS